MSEGSGEARPAGRGGALVTVTLWASAFVGIRAVIGDFAPGSLAVGRLAVGSLALGVLVAMRGFQTPARRDLLLIVASGLLWFAIYNLALNEAERNLDAGTAAMLVNTGPIFIALFAGLFLAEGFPSRLLIGLRDRVRRNRDHRLRQLGRAGRGGQRAVGDPAVRRRGDRVRGRRHAPEAGTPRRAAAQRHLAGLRRRDGRVPAVRARARHASSGRRSPRASPGSSTSACSRPRSPSRPGHSP